MKLLVKLIELLLDQPDITPDTPIVMESMVELMYLMGRNPAMWREAIYDYEDWVSEQ